MRYYVAVAFHQAHAVLVACSPTLNSVTPSATLPGSSLLTSILSGVLWFGIALSLIGVIISAIVMALGKHSNNGQMASRGHSGLFASIVAALVCGGAVALVNFAFSAGSSIHC